MTCGVCKVKPSLKKGSGLYIIPNLAPKPQPLEEKFSSKTKDAKLLSGLEVASTSE